MLFVLIVTSMKKKRNGGYKVLDKSTDKYSENNLENNFVHGGRKRYAYRCICTGTAGVWKQTEP